MTVQTVTVHLVIRTNPSRMIGFMEDVTLDTLRPGAAAHVLALDPQHPLRRRLLELGFIRGARVEVMRLAPLGRLGAFAAGTHRPGAEGRRFARRNGPAVKARL